MKDKNNFEFMNKNEIKETLQQEFDVEEYEKLIERLKESSNDETVNLFLESTNEIITEISQNNSLKKIKDKVISILKKIVFENKNGNYRFEAWKILEKSKIGMDFSPSILEDIYPNYFDDNNSDENYKKIVFYLLDFGAEGLNSIIRLLKRKYNFEDFIQINKYSILIELLSGIKENEKRTINCLNDIFLNNKITSIKISVLKTLTEFRDIKSKLKIIPKLVQDLDDAYQNLDSGEKLNFEDTRDGGKLFLKAGEEFLVKIGSEDFCKVIQEESNFLLQFYYTYALLISIDEELGWKYLNRFLDNDKFRLVIPERFEWIIESDSRRLKKI